MSYSDSARTAGIENLRLAAHVVRLVADSQGLVVHCQFSMDGYDGDWQRLFDWVRRLGRS